MKLLVIAVVLSTIIVRPVAAQRPDTVWRKAPTPTTADSSRVTIIRGTAAAPFQSTALTASDTAAIRRAAARFLKNDTLAFPYKWANVDTAWARTNLTVVRLEKRKGRWIAVSAGTGTP